MELCHAVLNTLQTGPALNHWTLANGVRCVEALLPEASLTCLDFWCRAGSSWEDPGEEGMAHFLEHMIFKGSQTLPAGAFDRAIEALGGSSNAATGFDDVHYHVLIPTKHTTTALDLLLDLVLQPSLNAADFELEREVVLEEIAQYADQPDEQVLQELLSRACPRHAYGRPILGDPMRLREMTPARMRRFHHRRYRGDHCCLAISGARPSEVRSAIEASALADLAEPETVDRPVQPASFARGRHEITVERLESARLLMLWPAAAAQDQTSVMGADLATTLLGEGRRSRLVAHLREDLRLAETVDMDLTVLEQGSLVTLEICCRDEDLQAVENAVSQELSRAADTAPASWELERAFRLVGNGLRFSLESTGQVAGIAASQTLWGRPQALLEPLHEMTRWTAETLQHQLLAQWQPEQACTLIAHPGHSD